MAEEWAIIEEIENEDDILLERGLTLDQAEDKLVRYLNLGHDAYLMFEEDLAY